MKFLSFLEHPYTRSIDIDDPALTIKRREIIRSKKFLMHIYHEWYSKIIQCLETRDSVLELGSGGGFLAELIPNLITSEIVKIEGVDEIVDACQMPFRDNSLNAIVMTNVFHHIPDIDKFLKESHRVIKDSGKIVMIEPWKTPWSSWIYSNLHSEPFEADGHWRLADHKGPLSSANGALPWIVFERDLKKLNSEYPFISVKKIELMMPFSYLLSGGVSKRSLAPGFLYRTIRFVEGKLNKKHWAMFALIELEVKK